MSDLHQSEESSFAASSSPKNQIDTYIYQLLAQHEPCVLLTIIDTQGSVARKAGTRAIYTRNGLSGTLGGGLFETRILEEAELCFHIQQSKLFTYQGIDDAGRGKHVVLIEYLDFSQSSLFLTAAKCIANAERGAYIVDLANSNNFPRSLLLACEPQDIASDFSDLLANNLVSIEAARLSTYLQKTGGKALQIKDDKQILYFEPFKIQPTLLLIGGGAVALETATLAAHCGFNVDVVDSRQEYASEERFPMARHTLHLEDLHDLVATCGITQDHYVVIMTHSQSLDLLALSQILASHACYIGMLGGTAKRKAIFTALHNEGIPQTELACVHTPVGLNIGAETPQEIAVAIVAELLAAKMGTLAQLKN